MRDRGFTLIELLIAVLILSIVAAYAIPAYLQQVMDARRSDAKVALTEAAQALERYYSLNNTYSVSLATVYGTTSPQGYYNLSLSSTTSSYTITASATGDQAGDSHCASFTLTHTGTQGATNSDCW